MSEMNSKADIQLHRFNVAEVPIADIWSAPARRTSSRRLSARAPHFCGRGVKVWPSAVERLTNIRVAGDEHTVSRGSSVRTGDSGQSPEAMSLLTCTTTVVSLVVS